MSANARLDQIEKRWKADRAIRGTDVAYLIEQARKADTLIAAKNLGDASRPRGPVDDILSKIYGGRP